MKISSMTATIMTASPGTQCIPVRRNSECSEHIARLSESDSPEILQTSVALQAEMILIRTGVLYVFLPFLVALWRTTTFNNLDATRCWIFYIASRCISSGISTGLVELPPRYTGSVRRHRRYPESGIVSRTTMFSCRRRPSKVNTNTDSVERAET